MMRIASYQYSKHILITAVLAAVVILMPLGVSGQGGNAVGQGTGQGSNAVGQNSGQSGSNAVGQGQGNQGMGGGSQELINPLRGSGITTVDGLLVALLGILVVIATPIVVIFIILAGFKYVTAQGDTNKLQEAKRALVYAIIGGVLIIGAEVLAEIIRGTVDSFR